MDGDIIQGAAFLIHVLDQNKPGESSIALYPAFPPVLVLGKNTVEIFFSWRLFFPKSIMWLRLAIVVVS